MKTAFIFPGQGAQYPGMGEDFYRESQTVRDLFAAAQEAVSFPVADTIFSGSAEDLKQTDVAQVAITLVNLSAAAVLRERGIQPDAVAGHSLGEYAALAAAGVIQPKDVFAVTAERGRIMAEESSALAVGGEAPGMAAVMGLEPQGVSDALAGREDVFPANLNSPQQTVISGTADGIKAAQTLLKEAGARRVIPLKVSGPFHSPLLQRAAERLGEFLQSIPFSDPVIPVFSNVTGMEITSAAQAKDLCIQQITTPVRWVEETQNMMTAGIVRFIEAGPGTVLAGLVNGLLKTQPNEAIQVISAGKMEAVQAL